MTGRERAAWGFVAPALIALAVFFVVPVVSSLLLSLTDFDIYALADLSNLR
jgi:multiple sugar transport system permease protein